LDFARRIKDYTNAPLTRRLLLEILREYKRPNDKISELIKIGELVSLRRGLYVPCPTTDLPMPEFFLIANHLRGPSYVSLEAALSYWGFIPERTYEISSVTVKPSKKYKTIIGRFGYQQLPTP
jgi:predicted transcriptional regulator of viral defense system